MDPVALAILIGCHFIGSLAAFGSALLSVPLLLLWWGPDALPRIVALVMCMSIGQASLLLIRNWKWLEIRRVWPLHLAAVLCIPLGMLLMDRLPRTPVVILLMILVSAAAIQTAVGSFRRESAPKDSGSPRRKVGLGVLSGAAGGLIHGSFGIGGSVLVAGSRLLVPETMPFRAAMSLLWTMLAGLYLTLTLLSPHGAAINWLEVAVALVGVLAATVLGDRLAGMLDPRWFARLVAVLLGVSVVSLFLSLFD